LVQSVLTRAARRRREIATGYLFLAPAIILIVVFEFFPILYGLYISACDWRLRCVSFVGLANYSRALGDSDAWHAFLITATYSLISVPVQLCLGLVLAYLLFQPIQARGTFRVIFFLPYITSTVASAAVWSYLYSPDSGPINAALRVVGLQPVRWLAEPSGVFKLLGGSLGVSLPDWASGPSLSLLSLIAFTTWVFVGYDVTIFLAGLANIPKDIYEAARVDGAGTWQVFRQITLPLLSPTTYFLLIFTVIGSFKAFNHIYIMTEGGPGNATMTASVFIFKQLFEFNRYGYSAALSFPTVRGDPGLDYRAKSTGRSSSGLWLARSRPARPGRGPPSPCVRANAARRAPCRSSTSSSSSTGSWRWFRSPTW
jgi:multiple sugar transport system permease protein